MGFLEVAPLCNGTSMVHVSMNPYVRGKSKQVPSDFPAGAYLRNGPNHPFYEERGEDHVFVRSIIL